MRQAWHIFKKDARHLYGEIAFLCVLAVLFGFFAHASLRMGPDASDGMQLLYIAAVAFTVARLIHAEAIPGECQFWITRPYYWRSLLTAKILFVVAFVQLPVMLMQMLVLLLDGFSFSTSLPGLLWTQVLIVVAISLPCVALAALTTGMVPFIATVVVLLLIGFITFESTGPPAVALGLRSTLFAPESIEWLRYTIPFIAAAIAVPPVLYLQYKDRRTRFSVALAAGIVFCGAIAFVFLSWPALFRLQSAISKQSFPVEIQRDPNKPFDPHLDQQGRLSLSLPLLITGVPAGLRTQFEMFDLRLQRTDGRIAELSGSRVGLHRSEQNPNGVSLAGVVYPDRGFLQGVRGQSVTLHLSIYLTLFGNTREQTIPFQTTPVNALDGLRCFDGYFHEIVCRAPFRWPGRWVSVKSPWGGLISFTHLISYAPFPANLQLAPIVERSAGTKEKSSGPQVTIEVDEPVQYLRRDIELPNLSLGVQ